MFLWCFCFLSLPQEFIIDLNERTQGRNESNRRNERQREGEEREKGEDREWDYIGSASEVTIETVFLEDSLIDIFELLETSSYKFINELEDLIIEKHENR